MVRIITAPDGSGELISLTDLRKREDSWAVELVSVIREAVQRVPEQDREVFLGSLNFPTPHRIGTGQVDWVMYAAVSLEVWDEKLVQPQLAYLRQFLQMQIALLAASPPVSREESERVQQQMRELVSVIEENASQAGWTVSETAWILLGLTYQAAFRTGPNRFGYVFRSVPERELQQAKKKLKDVLTRRPGARPGEAVDIITKLFSPPPAILDPQSRESQALSRVSNALSEVRREVLATRPDSSVKELKELVRRTNEEMDRKNREAEEREAAERGRTEGQHPETRPDSPVQQ